MPRNASTTLGLLSVLVTVMMVTGCITSDNDDDDLVKPGDLVTEDESTELGTAEAVKVYLAQSSGALDVSSGAAKLMEASFKYNIDKWKPEISYKEVGGAGNLSVVQPATDLRVATGARNEWDITLSNDVPIDLTVILGAGDSDVRIGDMNLTDVDVNIGAGDLDLHMGAYDGDNLTVSIICAAGSAKVTVPAGMGVRVIPLLGVGSTTANGFTMVGSEYHNVAYDPVQPHLIIHANLGVGNLSIIEA
jgi:hypothetical protein